MCGGTAYELVPEAWHDDETPGDLGGCGDTRSLFACESAVLDGLVPVPLDPWDFGDRGADGVFVGKGARIEGSVRHSVVSEGRIQPVDPVGLCGLGRC